MIFSFFFFSSRRRHTRCSRDWSSDVCSSDLGSVVAYAAPLVAVPRVWQSGRSRAVSIGLTFVLVVGCAVAGWALDFAAARAITWTADRNPCAAYRAGVTGSFGRLT